MVNLDKYALLKPRHTPTSAWLGHIPFAAWLIGCLRPKLLVELGTHYGGSYLAFCQAVQMAEAGTRCYAVDTWQGDEHAGTYTDEVYTELLAKHRDYESFSSLLRMTFDDAVKQFDDGSIDFLHIDGLHTYEAVRHDFETWQSKLSKRAVVLFHDTMVRRDGFGVWKYWSELSAEVSSFEFTHSYGLGVLLPGTEYPECLLEWVAKANRYPEETRGIFRNLGELIETRKKVDELEVALFHSNGDKGHFKGLSEIQEREFSEYRQKSEEQIDGLKLEIAQLESRENAQREQILATQDSCKALTAEIEGLHHRLIGEARRSLKNNNRAVRAESALKSSNEELKLLKLDFQQERDRRALVQNEMEFSKKELAQSQHELGELERRIQAEQGERHIVLGQLESIKAKLFRLQVDYDRLKEYIGIVRSSWCMRVLNFLSWKKLPTVEVDENER